MCKLTPVDFVYNSVFHPAFLGVSSWAAHSLYSSIKYS